MATLFERLGGTEGITRIVSDLVDLHLTNPRIATRFAGSDLAKLKHRAATFFIAGSGGPNAYEGKDMLSAHKGMNIDDEEFNAVLDDALAALNKHNVGQPEKEEVLFILYSMKKDVVRV
ncbi:MAG: group 1 truncated hemoglobin [Acidimicrobiia bacterium]|nr:group 1 truncated hemoglobin [Acidimicrobiia bacterium]